MASLVLSGINAQAQETVYRCGNEYTNAPSDASRCERLAPQAVTVIIGVRPQSSPVVISPQGQAPDVTQTPNPSRSASVVSVSQSERDVQARTILNQELQRVQMQHQTWVQEYKLLAPQNLLNDRAVSHSGLARVATLKAAIDRAERDMDSLRRELAARLAAGKSGRP